MAKRITTMGRREISPVHAEDADVWRPQATNSMVPVAIFIVVILAIIIVIVVVGIDWSGSSGTPEGQARKSKERRRLDSDGFPEGKKFIDDIRANETLAFLDVERRRSNGMKEVTTTQVPEEPGKSMVVKQFCDRDNEFYFVASDLPDRMSAARKLSEARRRTRVLIAEIQRRVNTGNVIKALDGRDITDNMKKLTAAHSKYQSPFSEYHNPKDRTVGSNCDKGMLIEVCLRDKFNPTKWNTDNSIFRVLVHELAHSADHHMRDHGKDGHGPDFYRLQNYLLSVAQKLGIYSKEEHKRSGQRFCGLIFNEKDEF
ncbi:hypothetical protein [Sicyoidochytrium minutum DNA virus]|nr:hypothetical protein [Sicyoidochytrium minutum DNA virus]